MSRAKIFALFTAIAFTSARAQTPAPVPAPSLPPVTEPATPTPSAPVLPATPVITGIPSGVVAPSTPLAPLEPSVPLPSLAPSTPLPPIAPDIDIDFEPALDLTVTAPRVRVDLGDVDIDVASTVSDAMAAVVPAIARARKSAMSYASPAVARAISRASYEASRFSEMTVDAVAPAISTSTFERQFTAIATSPQQGWASGDPADSLYRIARETLNRGEYRRASQLFEQITQKFPSSVYAADARYWRAFALYRIGSADDLREALRSLESGTGKYSSALQVDAPTLATRIRGALAARGDGRAATYIQREANQTTSTCDREDIAVRVEALNSLGQMDPESVTPMLRRLLQRKDECSAGLRRSALFLLAKRGDADALNLLSSAAKSDPDIRVRADAIRWIARLPGDQAVSTLIDLVNNGDVDELKLAAIEALGSSDNPRARATMRSLISRSDLNERMRVFALQSVDAEHTEDGGAFLRNLYPQLNVPSLQIADVRAIARIGGAENDQWLLAVVRNPNVALDVRRVALSYAGRSTIPIGDLVKMYDSMADRPLREALISLYTRRTEPEATDKLIDIAKNGTDPELRRLAISNLSRKNDPRTKKLLLEIIDK